MTPQEEFDQTYITSTEVMRRLNISRSTLLFARKAGRLPNPININDGQLFMWRRSDVESYLQAWDTILHERRERTPA